MKNKKRLSLDSFKEKANSVTNEEVLESVKGGGWWDCHGGWGQARKVIEQTMNLRESGLLK